MPTEASTLVRVVMERLGTRGPTALARELGMSDYGAPRKIGDWLDGKYAPNYEATMLMLERAGLVNLEADKPRETAADPSPLSPRQRCLLAAADDGYPPETLAAIFNLPDDEANTELQAARDELANWQETRSQEQTRGEEQTSGGQGTEPAGEPVLEMPSMEKLAQAFFAVIRSGESHEETGELTLESLDRQARAHHALITAAKAEFEAFQAQLQAQLERTGQATQPSGKETE